MQLMYVRATHAVRVRMCDAHCACVCVSVFVRSDVLFARMNMCVRIYIYIYTLSLRPNLERSLELNIESIWFATLVIIAVFVTGYRYAGIETTHFAPVTRVVMLCNTQHNNNVHCTAYIVHCTAYTVPILIVYIYAIYSTLYIVRRTPYLL